MKQSNFWSTTTAMLTINQTNKKIYNKYFKKEKTIKTKIIKKNKLSKIIKNE